MHYYSTNNPSNRVPLKEAIFRGLPPDNGLYMPEEIPLLPTSFYEALPRLSFQEIAFTVSRALTGNALPKAILQDLVEKSINFPAPLISFDSQRHYLELFHGPSLAFKDFGARFMAQLMQFFLNKEEQETTVLVATSGDTGAAVAAGFFNIPHIRVIILYPSKKVSALQEKQLTTWGGNITAVAIQGTFDDCQDLVKKAFLDQSLTKEINLSSANSINIARLIPQTFYYFEGYKQLPPAKKPTSFVIPSGNFGNLTAGLIAKKMGLPIHHLVAATNSNETVPDYLLSGLFLPRPSRKTISNAMDVGNPSNFKRILDLYCSTWNNIRNDIKGFAISDKNTEESILQTFSTFNYIPDPHGAVGIKALEYYLQHDPTARGIVLGTAHPAKFTRETSHLFQDNIIVMPDVLSQIMTSHGFAYELPPSYPAFREFLSTQQH